MPPHLLPAAPTCGVFHVLLVLDSINTNVVVQSRTTLPPPLPSPYTLAKPQKPPTHPTIPRGKTYNSIGKNPHKKYRKKTPKNTKKKGRRGVAHDGVQSFPRIIPFNGAIKSGDAGSLRTGLIAGLRARDGGGGFVAGRGGRGRRAALAAAAT